jgi:hypothetical protein
MTQYIVALFYRGGEIKILIINNHFMIEKFDSIAPYNKDISAKFEKDIKLEDIVFVRPTKPVTTREILEEMEKQGVRTLTTEDLETLSSHQKSFGRIELKDNDIVIEETPKPRELTE